MSTLHYSPGARSLALHAAPVATGAAALAREGIARLPRRGAA